jgi:hypothetical protein
VHFLGPPGTGKSHLAIALGFEAVKAGQSVFFVVGDNYFGRRVASRRDVTQAMDVVFPGLVLPFLVVEGGGDVGEGGDGGQRSALSTGAAGAPQAHRPHVHGLPGAQRPAPRAARSF